MPHLTERFSSYHSFAQSTLQEIYSETTLAASQRFEIATLESAIFWNDGESGFRFEAMPRFAQGSPVFGIAVADTNADGYDDLILAQNFFGPQNETGRYDSGAGVILESRGAGRFEALWPWQSGLLITGAATSITVADLDGDPWPDIVVAQNDGPLAGYTFLPVSLPSDVGPPRRVRLPAGRLAAGTRLLGSAGRGLPPTVLAEYQIGSGYLSQQGAVRWIRSGLQPAKIQWPDGSVEELPASQ
jgi:hypothetical protein